MLGKECAVCQSQGHLSEQKVTKENFPWFRNSAPQTELVWDESAYLCGKCEEVLKQFENGVITAQGEFIFGYCHTCQTTIHENTDHQALTLGAHSNEYYCPQCISIDSSEKKHLIRN